MTTEEIFNKLAAHICEGITMHNEMAKAYDFLGLWGLSKCHIYHVFEEKRAYCRLSHYYATHYFKLIQPEDFTQPKLLPESWYKYTTQAVDTNTKKQTIKELMTKWVEWERKTKKFYQEMRQELTTIGEIAAALKLDCYILDVSSELHDAEKKLLKLETINYDIVHIIEWQDKLHKIYKKKLGW